MEHDEYGETSTGEYLAEAKWIFISVDYYGACTTYPDPFTLNGDPCLD